MMADYLRGHKIDLSNGEWVYSDTKKPTKDNWKNRPCGECGLSFTDEGHDGCLGALPNVKNACCGHGIAEEAYIQFADGRRLEGQKAINKMNALKRVD